MYVIRAENIGKKYIIHRRVNDEYNTLRDVIVENAKKGLSLINPFIKSRKVSPSHEEFWALQDISLEIKEGERVGIIGRNGAGKSTFLKILSRITEPTKGTTRIRGRVASLLEVGTGFHPELTGRENVFLNAAVLGMKKVEIKKKFDEIVSFAEVEKFLDTPVKRYSSGMYMRLAFAVAAHLEPEILIVDEVLAVGDAQFQKKCLGKMQDVGREGRTVIFVSHNMQAVRQLCSRAVLLHAGRMIVDDTPAQVIEHYLHYEDISKNIADIDKIICELPYDPAFQLTGLALKQHGQAVETNVENGAPLEIEIRYRVLERTTGLRVFFDLYDDQEILLFRSFHDEAAEGIPTVIPGDYLSTAIIPANILGPIRYVLAIHAGIFNVRQCIPYLALRLPLFVEPTGDYNKAYLGDTFRGKIGPLIPWETVACQIKTV